MSTVPWQRLLLDLFDRVDEPFTSRKIPQRGWSNNEAVLSMRDIASAGNAIGPRVNRLKHLERGKIFSVFHRPHMEEARSIIRMLQEINDPHELQLAIGYLRDQINEEMFVHIISVFFYSRPDTRSVSFPPIEEVLPHKFLPSELISRAFNQDRRLPPDSPIVIELDLTGNDLDIEHRLAYWREDIGLNAHHWHWHVVYPFYWTPEMGGIKDRKGELFYYMHQQMLARYDAERLSHNLSRVVTLHDWEEPILEGYSPHLSKDVSGTVYASRPSNMVMQDIPQIQLHRLRTYYNRVIDSIHRGAILMPNGQRQPFTEETGINVLGDIVEPSSQSPNPTYYGDFHNNGHDVIARIHDPDGRYNEEIGAIGDPATAMRDPVFYRWHKFIDDVYQEYKSTLTPYTRQQLTWSAVTVRSISVQGEISTPPNTLQTFWQDRDIFLQRGLNFSNQRSVTIRTRHLQHEAFSYAIIVDNTTNRPVDGTVRIFMAPLQNEIREQFAVDEQRITFMEMDKFTVKLNPGQSTLRRSSAESSVTIATSKSFNQLVEEANETASPEAISSCSCGLPDHLLLPRGKAEGMTFQLFVMITNAADDRVERSSTRRCADAVSYCGILNEKYPDRKPMGFPFDRRIEAPDLDTFLTNNMRSQEITIKFRNAVADPTGKNILMPE